MLLKDARGTAECIIFWPWIDVKKLSQAIEIKFKFLEPIFIIHKKLGA